MLKWRFQERSFALAPDPQQSRSIVGGLMSEALVRWSSAAPVRFTHDPDLWDFEVVLRNAADCTPEGCVLASAFFPDGGRHELTVYPTMFEQSHEEQIETMIHEFDHVFVGRFAGAPLPAPGEVSDWRWSEAEAVRAAVARWPERFTPWFRLLEAELRERG